MFRLRKFRLPLKALYAISTVFNLPYFESISDISANEMNPSELYETMTNFASKFEIISSIDFKAELGLLKTERFQSCVIPLTLLIAVSSLFFKIRFSIK